VCAARPGPKSRRAQGCSRRSGRQASGCINPNFLGKKSTSPPQLRGVDYITPNLWNGIYHPLNFSKRVKLPPKANLKNHSKSRKIHKIKNSIVLDSKSVDLHNKHIIWYALVHLLQLLAKCPCVATDIGH
jgi:hypothetical protein